MRRIVLAATILLAASATQPVSAQTSAPTVRSRRAGEVLIERASLTTPQTGPVHFELGILYVPENRSDPNSRIIGVGFARFRSLHPSTAPPIFRLPGGPGDSYLRLLKQQSSRLAVDLKYLEPYRRVGDVVLMDQRGCSERGEVLTFRHRTRGQPLDQPDSLARSTADDVEIARRIVAAYSGKAVDLRGYTVKECAHDVNDLRQALGYRQITLVAASFGSQWSFAIMRLHPETIARALLSGVEPLDYGYDMPSHIFAAIQRVWNVAEKDPRWHAYLPPGGLAAAMEAVYRRFERAPQQVKVKDDKTGEFVTVTLGLEDLQREFLRTSEPAFLLSLYYERYDSWARDVIGRRRSHDEEILLIGPLIDTSLGVTQGRAYLLRTDPATRFIGQWNFDGYIATADVWPSPDVGDELRTEVMTRIPVVFVQGDWDRNTPIENTLNVAPYFINGRVLIVQHGEHSLLESIPDQLPEVMKLLQGFLRTGSTSKLPVRVTMPVGRFDEPDFPPPH